MSALGIETLDARYQEYLRDESRRVGTAQSISFPGSEQEVRQILKEMSARGVGVTVQGARTGIAGGAVPAGGHVLNLSRLRRITGLRHEVATGRYCLIVQPGVLLSELREALLHCRFPTQDWSASSLAALESLKAAPAQMFPPDPTEASASIGGMVASNASGALSFCFGPTGRHIEAMRLVLADGDVISLRRGRCRARGRRFELTTESGRRLQGELPAYSPPPVKCAAGYQVGPDMDLIDLFVGMEGTLGVVTEAELRLRPAPPCVWGIMAFMPSEAAALALVHAVRGDRSAASESAARHRPAAVELFNSQSLDLLRRHKVANPGFTAIPDIPAAYHTAVYAEYHGAGEAEVMPAVRRLGDILSALGGSEAETWAASNRHELERLKSFRHAVPEIVNLTIDQRRRREPALTKLGTDMSVPDADLERVMAMYNQGLEQAGLESVIFGHVGDNHLHVNILPRNLDDYARGKRLYLSWAREVVARGGSVSAEHGIGKLKTAFLELMAGAEGIAGMRQLKRLFDPAGILNRGNLFEAEQP